MRIKRQSSPNLSSISESWKNDWNEDSEPKRFLPPYKDGDDRGSDKNLTRSGGEEKRCSKRKKGEGGREGGGGVGSEVEFTTPRSTRRAKGATAKLVIIRPYFFLGVLREDGLRTSMAVPRLPPPRATFGP